MTVELLAQLGGILSAGGLALILLARPREARLVGLVLWGAGLGLIVPELAPAGQGLLAAVGVVALALAGVVLAFVFRRWPWSLPLLVLAAVPARVPISIGDESATLLVPLYLVVAGAAALLGWSLWRGENGGRELGRASWPVALFILWSSVSALWADESTEAAIDLFFFLLPFGLLALVVARLPWSDLGTRRLLGLLAGMALLFAAVGIGQWVARDIFWNEKVTRGNENSVLFRVNSLFWDPSIYGRFLVLAVLAIVVVLVFRRGRDWALQGAAVAAVLWVALLFTYSQSSFAALLAGLALVIVVAWRARGAAGIGALVLVAVAVALVAPPLESVRDKLTDPTSESVNRATRGRSDLITKGLRIAWSSPVVGVGVGNFASAYERRFDPPGRLRTPASHTTPVTVVAETGVIGLLLFTWLVGAVLWVAFASRPGAGEPARLTSLVAGFGLAAILVHALFYSAFLQDPTTWGLIGLAALAARAGPALVRHSEPEERASVPA